MTHLHPVSEFTHLYPQYTVLGLDDNAVVLFVPPGTAVARTLICSDLLQDTEKKLVIIVGTNAQLTIRDDDCTTDLVCYVQAGAQLDVRVCITDTVCKNIVVECMGTSAVATITVTYLLHNNQHLQIKTEQRHQVPDASSTVSLRGVLAGYAQVAHRGILVVGKDAHGTKAEHYNKTIMLSENSSVDSSPELEVSHQDVQCSHGSAVGTLDQEHLLYVCSRGVQKADAVRLLLSAFLGVSPEAMHDKTMDKLQELVNEKFAQRFSNFRGKNKRPSTHLF